MLVFPLNEECKKVQFISNVITFEFLLLKEKLLQY